jgi:hypothetical protein
VTFDYQNTEWTKPKNIFKYFISMGIYASPVFIIVATAHILADDSNYEKSFQYITMKFIA